MRRSYLPPQPRIGRDDCRRRIKTGLCFREHPATPLSVKGMVQPRAGLTPDLDQLGQRFASEIRTSL